MNLIIRKATTEDLTDLLSFQLQMAWDSEKLKLDASTCERGIRTLLERPSQGQYYIAVMDSVSVGCTLIQYEWSDWRCGMVWWIHSVYVKPEKRKMGVFKKIYEHLRNLVNEDPEVRGLRLYVDKSNLGAQKTYEQLGMSSDHYFLYEFMK